jgi:hypothetical protein
VGGLDVPPFDVADGLSCAALRPVAKRNLDESNQLFVRQCSGEDGIAMRISEDLLLPALELLSRVTWPEEAAKEQPSVVLIRTYATDHHDVPADA